MSVTHGKVETTDFYIGLQDRTTILPGDTKPKGKVFTVTMDRNAIYGAPTITLKAGNVYNFIIDAPGHPFYITSDSEGGGNNRDPPLPLVGAIQITPSSSDDLGNVGIEKGILTWRPLDDHKQMNLYYQCNNHAFCGYIIKVE
jgi:hypothetical protein